MDTGFFFSWRLVLFAVMLLAFLGLAAAYGLGKYVPKSVAARMVDERLPAWRRYQTISSLVLAMVALVLLGTELILRGACAVRGGPVFWVQCTGFGVMVATVLVDAFASKHFTGKW